MERNIDFCCDGTGNQKGTVNTNVVHLLRGIPTHNHQLIAHKTAVGSFSLLGLPRDNRIGTTLGKL